MSNTASEDLHPYLQATTCIDADHPDIVRFVEQVLGSGTDDSPRARATALYYAVRDGLRYDPYAIDLGEEAMRASSVLKAGYGWCVPKATLLAATCRAVGVPARLGYADVRNHLSTERLRRVMKTDVFHWHGYTSIYLDGKWVKATPAFNLSLCERFGLHPLEFDGTADSIYHPFDRAGNRHMEYLAFLGEFADLPLAQIRSVFDQHYPDFHRLVRGDFEADVATEISCPASD